MISKEQIEAYADDILNPDTGCMEPDDVDVLLRDLKPSDIIAIGKTITERIACDAFDVEPDELTVRLEAKLQALQQELEAARRMQ